MKKFSKQLLTLFLILSLTLTQSISVFANPKNNNNTPTNNSVLIVNNGIYINGSYYSQEEFEQLLDTAIPMPQKRQPKTAIGIATGAYFIPGIAAGAYFIPGIGQVLITATGVIIIGGVIIQAGSWTYNTVIQWLNAKKDNKKTKDKSVKDKIDKVLGGKRKIKDSSNTIYEGNGGMNSAKNDFNKLDPKNQKTYPNGTIVGELSDGTKVNLRGKSSDGRITIEIQGNWHIKIRYNQ